MTHDLGKIQDSTFITDVFRAVEDPPRGEAEQRPKEGLLVHEAEAKKHDHPRRVEQAEVQRQSRPLAHDDVPAKALGDGLCLS